MNKPNMHFFLRKSNATNWINTFLCDVLVLLGILILKVFTYNAKNYVNTKTFLLKEYNRNYLICVVLAIVLMTILSCLNLNAITLFYTGI